MCRTIGRGTMSFLKLFQDHVSASFSVTGVEPSLEWSGEGPGEWQEESEPEHHKLFDHIPAACKASYHSRQLAIDKRMAATKAQTGLTKNMKSKPTDGELFWQILAMAMWTSLCMLVYHLNPVPTSQVMMWWWIRFDQAFLRLGTTYIWTTFMQVQSCLLTRQPWSLESVAHIRKTREGILAWESSPGTPQVAQCMDQAGVLVKRMDTGEVLVCSTIHTGDTMWRKPRTRNGVLTSLTSMSLSPVIEQNEYIGGVDGSDQLIQSYFALKWGAGGANSVHKKGCKIPFPGSARHMTLPSVYCWAGTVCWVPCMKCYDAVVHVWVWVWFLDWL